LQLKTRLYTLFNHALTELQAQGLIPQDLNAPFHIERTSNPQHGDFACNMALILAKIAKMPPRELANRVLTYLPTQNEWIAKIDVAGPGFINVFLTPQAYYPVINTILTEKEQYGCNQLGSGQTVLIEFVSANPTGPLHVGHGRGAALGAALGNLLTIAGFTVQREYYVNDAGRQMDILATSIWLRYLELCGEEFAFPSNGYQGDYVWDIGASLHREHGEALHHTIQEIFTDIPPDAEQGGDKEIHIDALIARSKQLLGETAYQQVFQCGLEAILKHIRQDLEKFGVVYDNWFSERSLMAKNTVQQAIEKLTAQGHTYQEAGALWFRSSAFGDEKDRVVIRENGQFTYFASDIAYHLNKLERGFDRLINIWGSDHHGYVPRLKAVITALGADAQRLSVLLVQFVTLYRGQERVQMSTRSGEYVTLRELREEVGRDAARFFYVQRKSEQHLDFDLELAKTQSIDNPVYYIQYAYARIASVFRQLQDREQQWNVQQTVIDRLNTEHEQTLLITLSRYPEVIDNAVRAYEPHQLTFYLRELANHFHTYYNAYTFLVEEDELRNSRLSLIAAVQQVLKNGLTIIGISTPEVM
jgi:arginyl-tRNA synthetase